MSVSARLEPPLNAEPARGAPGGWPLLMLVALGVAMDLVLALGWLRPLSFRREPGNRYAGAPMVPILGQYAGGALRFAAPAVALCLLWLAAVVLARHWRSTRDQSLLFAFSALFLLTLLPMNPAGTQDIYHNVADGRLFWRYHVNPTVIPPAAYGSDPFIRHVWGYAELPSAYGPLWYELDGLPTRFAGDGVIANLVAQKAFSAVFLLAAVALAALAARALAPERTALVIVLGGWSPLLLWESAGNGHNDSLMAFFLAAALLAAARRSLFWLLPLLTLSALVKYTTILLAPLALLWLLRRPERQYRRVAASAALSLLLAAAVYAPMWTGHDTLAALRHPGMTFILSPATLLHGALAGPLPEADAARAARLLTGLAFLGLFLLSLLRTRGDARDLASRCFDVLFAYLLLASWWFWPWYLTWAAPVAALGRGWRRPAAYVACACGALLSYLYWWPDPVWRSTRWFAAYGALTAAVFLLPAVIWLAGPPWPPRRREHPTQAVTDAAG